MRNFNRNGSTTTTAPTGFVPAMHGAGRRAARWIVQLLLLQLVSLWNFSLPLPGRTGGQEPPLPEHGNQFVIDLANELWFAADDMLTAGAFMGDEGWAGRGESPATLGAVGINMRNAAEALLFADWWTVSGELEVAGASGEFYFDEEDFLAITGVLPEEDFETWNGEEAAEADGSSAARAALQRMSESMTGLAERVGAKSVAGQALIRTAENWRRAVRLLQGLEADEKAE
ncbi:Uncharacterized protein SCF082_LOCUS28080 [Durusdinium trenchii]|uniref:Uncharacterized protein n=1 Tax=Durusdinium trenchii TaxID=1381693 RepID=A0ABP0MHU2_9DINO